MKKKISYILLASILVFQLGACGVGDREITGTSNTEEIQDTGAADSREASADSEGMPDASAVLDLEGKDNSLNAYSAVVNTPLQTENPAGSIQGGNRLFLGASRGYYFMKHLYEKVDECWDELSYVTAEGEMGSYSFDLEHQLWDVGQVAGTNHYVAFAYEVQEDEADYRFYLTERDENNEVLREFPLDCLNGSSSYKEILMSSLNFAVDHSGVVHLIRETGGNKQYQLISPDGDILTECVPDGYIVELVALYDGRVAFLATKWSDEIQGVRATLQCADAETGQPVVLAAPALDINYFTLLDEKTLLYADQEGVYRSELSGKNPELLYRWIDHGITAQTIRAIQADEKGGISLIYDDSSAFNYNYIHLKPTTENVEICEITLAVSPHRMSVYQPLVVAFNKQYPSFHIELKSDYDQAALLTELIAGKGPALIDTSLTGFEEQEKLWEPLDSVMEQMGITEELQPSTLEMGKINGIQYGMVTDFRLKTLVTGNPDLKDWDYDGFLQCIEDSPALEAVFNFYGFYGGGDFRPHFIMNFLSHGIDDAYFFDGKAGRTKFDTGEFRRVLEMANKYCEGEEQIGPGRTLLEEKVLCNELQISKPEDLALYRVCYGENANYIGYPTKDGSVHFMDGSSPLAIRRTVTEEEKAVAVAFINVCLSYEGQSQAVKDLNFGLSVRRDVLEEQIAAMNADTEVFLPGFDPFTIGNDLNIELDRKTLLDIIEKARPVQYLPKELMDIRDEELGQYFSGTISEDKLIDNLESRVGLYLGERN